MTIPFPGIDTADQTLLDAWWTPGWTSQNQAYIPAPSNPLNPGHPAITYVNVTGRYFDMDDNPLGGFLTFTPSDSATLTVDGVTWRLPKRPTGIPLPILFGPGGPGWSANQFGSGKVYIQGGLLAVALMPTDTSGLTTDSGDPLVYHVAEHMQGGRTFNITVPGNSSNPVDLFSLIVSDTAKPFGFNPVAPLTNEGGMENPI